MSMRTRILVATLLLVGTAAGATTTVAATFPEEQSFTQSSFESAQKAGEPILVHVTASWCTTCAAQKPIIDKLRAEPKFKSLRVFNIDFDGQKKLVHRFDARMQSTLIVFKGATEAGRSSGETEPAAIAALLGKAV